MQQKGYIQKFCIYNKFDPLKSLEKSKRYYMILKTKAIQGPLPQKYCFSRIVTFVISQLREYVKMRHSNVANKIIS